MPGCRLCRICVYGLMFTRDSMGKIWLGGQGSWTTSGPFIKKGVCILAFTIITSTFQKLSKVSQ